MSAQEAFDKLKDYFENRPAARQVVSCLKPGVEIGINIGEMVDCALLNKNGLAVMEQRPAENADFLFNIRPESVYVLSSQPSDDIPDIAIAIFKEMLAGNISARFLSNFGALLNNGYLDILKLGGSRVMGFLAMHGMVGVSNIMNTIKKMRQ